MTRILDAILSRLSAWHHQREADRNVKRLIRNIMAQDARQRAEDRKAQAQYEMECE